MTEQTEAARDNSSSSQESRRNSRKSLAPVVHDATFTRRPRPSFSSGSRDGAEASHETPAKASGASIARKRLIRSPASTGKKKTAILHTAQEEDRSAHYTHPPKSQVQPSASTIFSTTIQDLEALLNEALHIARVAAEDHEEEICTASPKLVDVPSHEQNGKRKMFIGDVTSASHRDVSVPSPKFLLTPPNSFPAAGRKQFCKQDSIKPCGTAHKGGLEAKSSFAEPQISYVLQQDWAQPFHRRKSLQSPEEPKRVLAPKPASMSLKEPLDHILRRKTSREELTQQREVVSPVRRHFQPPILPRSTSKRSRRSACRQEDSGTELQLHDLPDHKNQASIPPGDPSPISDTNTAERFNQMFGLESSRGNSLASGQKHINLNGYRHVDVKGSHDFDVHNTSSHQPVARDWDISRKRFAATIACVNTSVIGIIIGIYAGEVPAIQYVIVDLGHFTILGNVVLYLGLAIPTILLWPLPLMHGRKPYTIMALAVALCLQIPQGIAVSNFRSPDISTYRKILLLSRALSGFALGFVNINLQATLLDLFGASLQSGNPHQEIVDLYDVRRHGGGMGLWLGLWSWCSVGSISIGFFIGTLVVENAEVTWGFWISLILLMVVLLLNIIGPEVRRSAFRRTVAEVMGDEGQMNRVSRGEVKMHLKSAGPYWWGEEVKAGLELCWKMFRQAGFAVLAVYIGWTYAHFTLILMV
jgi:MFS family permease